MFFILTIVEKSSPILKYSHCLTTFLFELGQETEMGQGTVPCPIVPKSESKNLFDYSVTFSLSLVMAVKKPGDQRDKS